jgi:hypothetical protein
MTPSGKKLAPPSDWGWGTLASIATVLGVIGGLVVWVFGYLVTRADFVAHVQHDAGVQAWNQFGFAANRLEYLDDKQAECDAKKMTQTKMSSVDTALCTRYEGKYKTKTAEAADLKAKALEATKEK